MVEPFGMDECWLDVTGSRYVCGDARTIAENIRRSVKEELGLTVSIGVSFNKVFAKLGSDTKAAREAQAEAIGAFMFEVQELDTLSEFDEKLWLTVIDTVTVQADGRMTFKFQGGTEIEA